MIPLKLTLRNFLCYRDGLPPLDLRGIHLACLCGANGHGKSALLDAMTWCVWGQARTGAQNYNALIAYGETECRVELEFMAQGQTYRAIRRRRQTGRGGTGRGRTEADLFILDDAERPRPITGNTLGETDAKIRRIVGMDYATFINSAFLLQGRADEFTGKTPGQRKEVLSSILGLEQYDALRAAAQERRNYWRDQVSMATGALEQSRSLLEGIADPAEALARIGRRMSDLEGELAAATKEAAQQQAKAEELRRRQRELTADEGRLGQLHDEIRQGDAAIITIRRRIEAGREVAAQGDAIREGARQLAAARRELQRQETARQEYDGLRSRRIELQQALERERADRQAEAEQLRRRIEEELEPAAAVASRIAGELAALAERERQLQGEQEEIQGQTETAAELQGEIAIDQAALTRCVAEGKTLRNRQQEMQSVDAACPLCLTPLSEDACGNISAHYDREIAAKLQEHSALQQNIRELQYEHDTLTAEIKRRSRSHTAQQRQAQQERGRLQQAQQQAEAAQRQLATAIPRRQELAHSLATDAFAVAQRTALAQVEAGIKALAYDEAARAQAYRQTQSLQRWQEQEAELAAALKRLPMDESELAERETQAARRRQEAATLERKLAEGRVAVAELPAVAERAALAERAAAELTTERDNLVAERARRQGDAERRAELQAEIERREAERGHAEGEWSVYAELHEAFGRSGAPAMLIDHAVPHIENEANRLLGRMTDNRLALRLETQRVNQGGNVVETLDIMISDELGSRSYELFSGGEAFRINLSLRIALSKVLSQRLGFPLPTLFIDEGFGTQDAAGRERMVDAIAAIQNEFEKIIVITHLDDLKDLFPVRIEVLKTEAGAQFWLS